MSSKLCLRNGRQSWIWHYKSLHKLVQLNSRQQYRQHDQHHDQAHRHDQQRSKIVASAMARHWALLDSYTAERCVD